MANPLSIFGANPKATRNSVWVTPNSIFDPLNAIRRYSLDAAADDTNHKVALYLTEREDALQVNWFEFMKAHGCPNFNVWLNPPYENLFNWVWKTHDQSLLGCETDLLVPPSVDCRWYSKIAKPFAADIKTYDGRIKFIDPTGKGRSQPGKGNMLALFRPPYPECWI